MYVKTRQLSAKEVKELDTIAQKKGVSREKLVTDILRQFLTNTLYLDEHKIFFEKEVAEVIQVLERNNEIFKKVSSVLEERGDEFGLNY
jgi:metal-responsive CopG/Arc/MetJ family transcriptional regulator